MKRRAKIHKALKYNFVLTHLDECRSIFVDQEFNRYGVSTHIAEEAALALGYSPKTTRMDIIRVLRPIYFRVVDLMKEIKRGPVS